jgi:proteasome alpha subunit
MSMPFYVAPEQFMKDKADFARKNIARGRPLVATVYADGILICAENQSKSLHKVSEIYDRIAFAGVGRYNEFDSLRRAGVQHADIKGYQFSREDVDARSLANLYAQYMGNVFTHEMKPLEVEILVAEVGTTPAEDQLFHILYDGSVVDEDRYSVLGGEADAITARLEGAFEADWDLQHAIRAAAAALAGPERTPVAADLEVAILGRSNGRRAFQRLADDEVGTTLQDGAASANADTDGAPSAAD